LLPDHTTSDQPKNGVSFSTGVNPSKHVIDKY